MNFKDQTQNDPVNRSSETQGATRLWDGVCKLECERNGLVAMIEIAKQLFIPQNGASSSFSFINE
jgi:hypothetical protein